MKLINFSLLILVSLLYLPCSAKNFHSIKTNSKGGLKDTETIKTGNSQYNYSWSATPSCAIAQASITTTDDNCYGTGQVTETITDASGTNPYTFSWSNGTNTHGSAKSATISGLTAGTSGTTYSVTVTDKNGCSVTASISISEPTAVTATPSVISEVSCNSSDVSGTSNNGSVQVTASTGIAPYTFLWSNSATTSSISGLTAGTGGTTYTVTVTDNHGCAQTATVSISEPPLLTAIIVNGKASACGLSNGYATASVAGGTSPYFYSWNTIPVQTNQIATGLIAGNYTVTVTDNNSCTTSASVSISVPAPITATPSVISQVSCNSGDASGSSSNGSVQVSAAGGSPPYTYLWNNNAATSSISGLTAGTGGTTYSVTVTDNLSCSTTASVSISEPAQLTATPSLISNVVCFGQSNGIVAVTASGGTSPYTYLWNYKSKTTTSINALTAGTGGTTYAVTVTDHHGCTATASISISMAASTFTVTPVVTDVSCYGGSDGSIQLNASGGEMPYSYSWVSSNNTNSELTGLTGFVPGSQYIAHITDNFGCETTVDATVNEPAKLIPDVFVSTIISCFGNSNGAVSVTANGGIPPYTYLWQDSENSTTMSGLTAGVNPLGTVFSVTVTDNHGCTATGSVKLSEPGLLTAIARDDSVITCFGLSNGSVKASVTGGTKPYAYAWSDTYSQTNQQATGLSVGAYSVTVTDANGCMSSSSMTLTQPPQLNVSIISQSLVQCGGNDNIAAAIPTGGTPKFNFYWSNGATTQIIYLLPLGPYSITVTDKYGCTASANGSFP